MSLVAKLAAKKKDGHFLATLSYVYKGNVMAGPFVSLEDRVDLAELKKQMILSFEKSIGSKRDPSKTRIKLPSYKMIHVDQEEHWNEMKAKWRKGRPMRINKKRQNIFTKLLKLMTSSDDHIGWTNERQLGAMGLWEFTVRAQNCRDLPTPLLTALVDCMKRTDAPNVVLESMGALWMMTTGHSLREGAAIRAKLRQMLMHLDAVQYLVPNIIKRAEEITHRPKNSNEGTGGAVKGNIAAAFKNKKGGLNLGLSILSKDLQSKQESAELGKVMQLQILSASGLAKADTGKGAKSDPYCIILFDDHKIGETVWIDNDLNPVWPNERHTIPLPKMLQDGSKVVVEVRDHDARGLGDFLGQVVFTGKQIKEMISANEHKKLNVAAAAAAAETAAAVVKEVGDGGEAADSHKVRPGTEEEEGTVTLQLQKKPIHHLHHAGGSVSKTKSSSKASTVRRKSASMQHKSSSMQHKASSKSSTRSKHHGVNESHLDDSHLDVNALVQGDLTFAITFEDQVVSCQDVRELKVQVVAAEGLAQADKKGLSDPYCLIYWNEKRIGQTAVCNDDQDPEWQNEHFVVELPADISKAHLRVECRDHDKGRIGDFLGCVELSGTELTALPTGETEYPLEKRERTKEDMSLVQGTLTLKCGIVERVQYDVSVPMEYMEEKGGKSTGNAVCKAVTINVHGANKLAKADKGVGNASDPFVTVFWNNKRVGMTSVIQDNCNPVWEDECFVLALPPKHTNSLLRLEIADQDNKGFGDFLGQIELQGNGMKEERLRELGVNDYPQGKSLELKKKPRINQKKQKVKGDIAISFDVDDTPCVPVCLHILAAMGLAKADKGKGGKSDPYCLVYWNGKKLGHSSSIENSHDPVWTNETFLIPIPTSDSATATAAVSDEVSEAGDAQAPEAATGGDTTTSLANSELVIEVRDFDSGGVLGDFLGQIVLKGGQLDPKQVPTAKTEFQLQKKAKHTLEDMSLVQGSVFIKFSSMGSAKLQARDVGKLRGW